MFLSFTCTTFILLTLNVPQKIEAKSIVNIMLLWFCESKSVLTKMRLSLHFCLATCCRMENSLASSNLLSSSFHQENKTQKYMESRKARAKEVLEFRGNANIFPIYFILLIEFHLQTSLSFLNPRHKFNLKLLHTGENNRVLNPLPRIWCVSSVNAVCI